MASPRIPRTRIVRHHTDIVTTAARRKFDSDIIVEEDYDVTDASQTRKSVKKAVLVSRHNTEVLRKRPPDIDLSPPRPSEEVKVTRRTLSRHGSRVQHTSKAQVIEEKQSTTASALKSLGSTTNTVVNKRRKHLEEISWKQLNRHASYMSKCDKRTPGYEHALSQLLQHRRVVLTGNLGSGKTFTALNLLQAIVDSNQDYTPIVLQSVADLLVVVDPSQAMVVLADDFLGNVFYSPSCIAHWNRVSSDVNALLKRKRMFLILTSERDSLDFVKSEPFYDVIHDYVIDLDSDYCTLNVRHRDAILNIYKKSAKRLSKESSVNAAGTSENGLHELGFPLACRIYSLRDDNDTIHKTCQEFLLSTLQRLRKNEFLHYFVLVLAMLCGGRLKVTEFTKEHTNTFDQLSRLYKIEITSFNDILTVARQLVDTYLSYDDDTECFEFLHNTFYYATMHSFIHEHTDYAIELIPIEEIAIAFGCKKLSRRVWDLVGQSVSPELTQNELNLVLARYKSSVESKRSDLFNTIAHSVMWRNEVFVDLTLAILGVTFFMTEDVECKPFAVHMINNGNTAAIGKVLTFVAQFRGEKHEYILPQIQKTLEELCKETQDTSFETILTHLPRIDNDLMCAAARGGNTATMQLLLRYGGQLKKHELFEVTCSSSRMDMLEFLFSQFDADSQFTLLRKRDGEGRTIVHHAAMAITPALLEFLVQHGGDALVLTKEDRSILHIASSLGRIDTVKYTCTSFPNLVQQTDINGFRAAHCAALEGHTDVLEYLVSEGGVNPTLLVAGRNTILHLAAYNGRTEIVRIICRRYKELVHLKNVESYTAPQLAATSGHLDTLKEFFSCKFDPYFKTVDGRTFLHLAAFHGHLHVVQYLCSEYPDLIDMVDNDGNSAGHDAAASGNVPVLEYLTKSGIDPVRRSFEGCTLIHDACYYGRKSMVEYLCDNHPDLIDMSTVGGYTACHGAALGGFVDIFELLVQKGADIYAVSADQSSMLHEAAYNGKLQMVQHLCITYPEMNNRRNQRSYLPYHFAAQEGHLEVLQYLISQSDNPHSKTAEEQTCLHISSYNGRLDVVKYLCRQFPDMIPLKDSNGASAIHYSARGGHVDVLTFLMGLPFDYGERTNNDSTILHLAAYDGKLDVVRYICRKYPQLIHAADKFQHNAIHYAAGSDNLELLKYLMNLGIDSKLRTDNGGTVLLKAAYNGRLENVQYLCEAFPELVHEVDVYGCGVAHYAVCSGSVDVLRYVTELDIDPLATTSDDHTLLHIAAFHGRIDMVKYLYEKYPAMCRATDNMGNTPEMYAALGEQKQVARFLQIRQKLDSVPQVGEESSACVCCLSGNGSCIGCISEVLCFCRRD